MSVAQCVGAEEWDGDARGFNGWARIIMEFIRVNPPNPRKSAYYSSNFSKSVRRPGRLALEQGMP